jgi:hypothetical protein
LVSLPGLDEPTDRFEMAIFWDAHVHIYPNFDLNVLLDAAVENFDRAASQAGLEGPSEIDRVLLLAEAGDLDVFGQLARAANHGPAAGQPESAWAFSPTMESHSLVARKGEELQICLVAGRQVISLEEIELLAVGCAEKFDDREFSLPELARRVADRGGIPVLPWGVGKWMGRRGQVVQRFLDSPPDCFHAFGDNGNRPFFWPIPQLLNRARRENRPILSGSDPLPLAGHNRRAGSFGGWTNGNQAGADRLDSDRPAESLAAVFREGGPLRSFGQGAGAIRFFRDQIRMQVRRRLRGLSQRGAK